MLADLSKIAPVREAVSPSEALRRLQDKNRAQKVLPRENDASGDQKGKDGRQRGQGLNAYA